MGQIDPAPAMGPPKKHAKQVLGSCIRALRLRAGLTLEQLASKADVSYQYLSGVETGKENFSINVLEKISGALGYPVVALVEVAYNSAMEARVPMVDLRGFRQHVPLPEGVSLKQLEAAMNEAQTTLYRVNSYLRAVAGRPLAAFMQDGHCNEFVAEVFAAALAAHTDYSPAARDGARRLRRVTRSGRTIHLEVHGQQAGKLRCDSEDGRGGWHVVPVYEPDAHGDVRFVQLMVAELREHGSADSDWIPLNGSVPASYGRPRLTANRSGLTRLLDGTAYILAPLAREVRELEYRKPGERVPAWSILAA